MRAASSLPKQCRSEHQSCIDNRRNDRQAKLSRFRNMEKRALYADNTSALSREWWIGIIFLCLRHGNPLSLGHRSQVNGSRSDVASFPPMKRSGPRPSRNRGCHYQLGRDVVRSTLDRQVDKTLPRLSTTPPASVSRLPLLCLLPFTTVRSSAMTGRTASRHENSR